MCTFAKASFVVHLTEVDISLGRNCLVLNVDIFTPPNYVKYHPEFGSNWAWRTAYQDLWLFPSPSPPWRLNLLFFGSYSFKTKIMLSYRKNCASFACLSRLTSHCPHCFCTFGSDLNCLQFPECSKLLHTLCLHLCCSLCSSLPFFGLANSYPSTPNSVSLHHSGLIFFFFFF